MARCWSIEPEDFEAHPYTVFLEAVRAGDIRKVREYLSEGGLLIHPGEPLPPTTSALIEAVKNRKESICAELLSIVEDINETDVESGSTALHWAAKLGCLSVAEELVKKQANIEAVNWYGMTPLHQAAHQGHKAVLQLLLDEGADVNAAARQSGATALHFVSDKGFAQCAELLVSRQAVLDAVDAAGFTPLLIAARKGHLSVVQMLLRLGASARIIDHNTGRACVHWAAYNGHNGIVLHLLKDKVFEVDVEDGRKETPLLLAARRGHASLVKELLELGANVDVCNSKGVTPLINAAFFGHSSIVEMLLCRGCQVCCRDEDAGRTALHWAAANDHPPVVTLLLQSSDKHLHQLDGRGMTALDVAEDADAQDVVNIIRAAIDAVA